MIDTALPLMGDAVVLTVNDHDGVRYMISRMLDRAGVRTAEAASGREALAKVQKLRPKIVVLDIKLPDISGLEVCRAIKADPRTQSIKVLHTSAIFVAPEAKVQSLNSGADGYLSHPFEQEELIATVRSLLRLSEAEQELRDTAAELQEANRRTHEFLAMLAHELRNPLSAITTCLPVIERAAPRDELERSAWQIMRRQTQHLRRLVDDLLDAARVTQGKIEPRWETVDLTALLARITDGVRRALTDGREQQLLVDLPQRAVSVRADSLRLEQVFTNLLDNASKYTDDGGRIEVRLSVPDDGMRRARVTVRDTGIGIPPEVLANVFNLFTQADVPLARSRGGLGIGLTLVRTLVELHGGRVCARSDGVGKGCEIEVDLPLLAEVEEAPSTAPSVAAAPEPEQDGTRRRVLIVEDNADAQQMLKCLLELWGHEVIVASDGLEGLEALRTERPEVALIDIGLPVADGYELARRARGLPHRSASVLVALTGYGAPEQRARALAAGFDMHLVKPVDPDELAALIAAGPAEIARAGEASAAE